jgi:hypothetical protein
MNVYIATITDLNETVKFEADCNLSLLSLMDRITTWLENAPTIKTANFVAKCRTTYIFMQNIDYDSLKHFYNIRLAHQSMYKGQLESYPTPDTGIRIKIQRQ